MNIKIRKAELVDLKQYKLIKIKSIETDSLAFGETIKEIKKLTNAEWKKSLEIYLKADQYLLFAFIDEKIAGTIRISFDNREKYKHIVYVYGFYVDPDFRGHDVGKKLMKEALEEVKRHPEVIKIKLYVTATQKAAINFYKKFGFKLNCKMEKEEKDNGQFYDSYLMEKFL